jgi:hypothetical protein
MRDKTYVSLFHTNFDTKETKEIKFAFDKIDKVNVDISLTVCSSDTVRGRNKTDHAYRNQNTISMSGFFSERTVDQINSTFFKFGTNKLKNLQELFLSFLKDGRLFYVCTRFKTYKNYVLKGCSFSYSNSVSSIKVDLTFVEVMFRNNQNLYLDILEEEVKVRMPYCPPLTDAVTEKSIVDDSFSGDLLIPVETIKGDLVIVNTYNKVVGKLRLNP